MYAIETFNLTRRFWQRKGLFKRKELTVLDNISLNVPEGRVFGLLGTNGAGKTTLVRLLSGLILPTSGTAQVNGYNLAKDELKIKSSVGIVFNNERSFYWRLSVTQNLEFFASLYNMPPELSRTRITELLELMGLWEQKDSWVEVLSSGMKQRLSIARGLLNDPKIIFMDEPTKGLDPLATQKTWGFIQDELVAKRKKTIFLCTNYLEEAKNLCDSAAIIHKGRVIAVINCREEKDSLKGLFNKLIVAD